MSLDVVLRSQLQVEPWKLKLYRVVAKWLIQGDNQLENLFHDCITF